MRLFGELDGPTLDKIKTWLGRTEFASLAQSLDTTATERFNRVQEREMENAIKMVRYQKVADRSTDDMIEAARMRICVDVLNEILHGQLILLKERHAKNIQEV